MIKDNIEQLLIEISHIIKLIYEPEASIIERQSH